MLNFLTLIPANKRKWIYATLGLAAFAIGVWQASHGNWVEFIISLVFAANNAVAGKNVNEDPPPEN